jgi:hypothetical protein
MPSIYNREDATKLDQAERDLAKARNNLLQMENAIIAAKVLCAGTLRNRYRFNRRIEGQDPVTAFIYAVIARAVYGR